MNKSLGRLFQYFPGGAYQALAKTNHSGVLYLQYGNG